MERQVFNLFMRAYDNSKAYLDNTERQPVLHMHDYYVQKMKDYNVVANFLAEQH